MGATGLDVGISVELGDTSEGLEVGLRFLSP